ncbi:uncharacterized protein BJ171DRAFT_32173 [Polychytrium aggregatum]|uniref:uncharacterized protein n=1 Tax=Polychytrium aggregatum TaxID=110093 RepID=UPI0022FDC4C2|nr:uncharacterized protein BJ171DRAFT_32173 [Polychytrium aggregatum]KAI9206530.1 hypothetical protein BJ171DRAFT_32173 [Polychytrium aggregatum]
MSEATSPTQIHASKLLALEDWPSMDEFLIQDEALYLPSVHFDGLDVPASPQPLLSIESSALALDPMDIQPLDFSGVDASEPPSLFPASEDPAVLDGGFDLAIDFAPASPSASGAAFSGAHAHTHADVHAGSYSLTHLPTSTIFDSIASPLPSPFHAKASPFSQLTLLDVTRAESDPVCDSHDLVASEGAFPSPLSEIASDISMDAPELSQSHVDLGLGGSTSHEALQNLDQVQEFLKSVEKHAAIDAEQALQNSLGKKSRRKSHSRQNPIASSSVSPTSRQKTAEYLASLEAEVKKHREASAILNEALLRYQRENQRLQDQITRLKSQFDHIKISPAPSSGSRLPAAVPLARPSAEGNVAGKKYRSMMSVEASPAVPSLAPNIDISRAAAAPTSATSTSASSADAQRADGAAAPKTSDFSEAVLLRRKNLNSLLKKFSSSPAPAPVASSSSKPPMPAFAARMPPRISGSTLAPTENRVKVHSVMISDNSPWKPFAPASQSSQGAGCPEFDSPSVESLWKLISQPQPFRKSVSALPVLPPASSQRDLSSDPSVLKWIAKMCYAARDDKQKATLAKLILSMLILKGANVSIDIDV